MKVLATATMVSVTLLAMSAAHADGKTRDEVRAELQAAKADGLVTSAEQEYPPKLAAPSVGKTREQVRAELKEAKARGLVTFGELDYPPKAR